MTTPLLSSQPLLKIINASLVDFPNHSKTSFTYNYGSLLGIFIAIKILSRLLLAIHFTAHMDPSIIQISHISQNVILGCVIHSLHSNRANFVF